MVHAPGLAFNSFTTSAQNSLGGMPLVSFISSRNRNAPSRQRAISASAFCVRLLIFFFFMVFSNPFLFCVVSVTPIALVGILLSPILGSMTPILRLGRSIFSLRQEIPKLCGFPGIQTRLTFANNLDHANPRKR